MRFAKRKFHGDFGSLVHRSRTPGDHLSDMWAYNAPPDIPPVYGPVRVCQRLNDDEWKEAVSSIVEAFTEICLHLPKHAEIVGPGFHSERKDELQQLNDHFYFTERKVVCEFLQQHRFLIAVLFEVRKKIDQIFGSETLSNLELFTDPEDNHSVPRLFALILTNLSSADASTRLDQLDREWWLNQPGEVRRVLSIDVDYLDGGV
jgi:hypothetical protein